MVVIIHLDLNMAVDVVTILTLLENLVTIL